MISTRNRNLAGFGNNIDSYGNVSITSLTLDSAHLGDNATLYLGTDDDMSLYHNGSHLFAYNNTGSMYFRAARYAFSDASGNIMFEAYDNADVKLYYAHSQRMRTTVTGIDVTGDINVDSITLAGESLDSAWVAARSSGGGGSSVTVSETAPASPSAGDMWFDAANGYLFVYYEDVDTSQWVQTTTAGDNPLAYDSDTSTYLLVGNLTTTGDVNTQSDARLKTDIEQINSALDKVSRLRGVEYNKDGKRHIGLIAQEVEQVIPEVVSTANDPMETKSVAYGNIVGLLVEAINELRAEVESLKENK